MKRLSMILLALLLTLTASAQRGMRVRKNVPLDSIRLSDPAILADQKTKMYYMTGTGGMELADIVYGVVGFLAASAVLGILYLVYLLIRWLLEK